MSAAQREEVRVDGAPVSASGVCGRAGCFARDSRSWSRPSEMTNGRSRALGDNTP